MYIRTCVCVSAHYDTGLRLCVKLFVKLFAEFVYRDALRWRALRAVCARRRFRRCQRRFPGRSSLLVHRKLMRFRFCADRRIAPPRNPIPRLDVGSASRFAILFSPGTGSASRARSLIRSTRRVALYCRLNRYSFHTRLVHSRLIGSTSNIKYFILDVDRFVLDIDRSVQIFTALFQT